MVNTATQDFQRVTPPAGNVGQFFVQGTIFYIMPGNETTNAVLEGYVPRVVVTLVNAGVTGDTYTLVPETPNGASPIDFVGGAPPAFWQAFEQGVLEFFQGLVPGCQVKLDYIVRWEDEEIVVDQGIVFSQN